MLAASQCVFAYARRMLLPRTYSPVSGRTALQHILQFFELLWIRLGRNDPCRQVRKRRAFAQLRMRCYCRGIRRIHPKQQIAAYEPARRVSLLLCLCMAHCLRANFSFSNCCGFGRDAIRLADRLANASLFARCRGIRRIHPARQLLFREQAPDEHSTACLCMAHCLRAYFRLFSCLWKFSVLTFFLVSL